jgi:hypothetical protein
MKYNNGIILPPLNSDDISFRKVGISFCFKNIFKDLLFDENKNGEDYDMIKKTSKTNNFIITPEVFYLVRHYFFLINIYKKHLI